LCTVFTKNTLTINSNIERSDTKRTLKQKKRLILLAIFLEHLINGIYIFTKDATQKFIKLYVGKKSAIKHTCGNITTTSQITGNKNNVVLCHS